MLPMGFAGRAAAPSDGVLRVRNYGDMSTMDPAHSVGVVDETILAAVYNKLTQYTPVTEWGWKLDGDWPHPWYNRWLWSQMAR